MQRVRPAWQWSQPTCTYQAALNNAAWHRSKPRVPTAMRSDKQGHAGSLANPPMRFL
jgi:hypothetical protein